MRKECEQHYTPARDNQYRSTARYYADNCPYCGIDRLTAQLAEANERCRLLDEKAGDWQHRYAQETMRLQSQLAERDAEIEELNELVSRYDGIKDELQTDKAELQQENTTLREEVERLTERLQANAAKIDEEDVVIEWADYLELKAEARKQAAQECASLILGKDWQTWKCECEDDYECTTCRIKSKFGLEG